MTMIEKIMMTAKERGLTQGEIEKLCGLAMNRVSRWKNGEGEPTARQLYRIANLLRVPMRYLVDDAVNEPVPDVDDNQRLILALAEKAGYDLAIRRLMGLSEPPTARPAVEATTEQRFDPVELDPKTRRPVVRRRKSS